MSQPIKIILNASGGRLGAHEKVSAVEQAMRAAGLNYPLVLTEHPGHATDLARQAVIDGCTTVIAAGGDGTINEVVNGLFQAADDGAEIPVTLGILPLGSANDLAAALNLPGDLAAACRILARDQPRLIDVGCVNGHYFVNNAAVGLEPVVTIAQHQMRWIKGTARYVVAALKTIIAAKQWHMCVEWDSGMYNGPMVLVSVGNGIRTGGAFYFTPRSKLDDGKFDFVYALAMSRLNMLALLPKTFSGKHIGHPKIAYLKSRSVRVTASPATPIQADGEVIETAATEILFEIVPQKLRVLV